VSEQKLRTAKASLQRTPVFGQPQKRPSRKSHLEERMALWIDREQLPRPVRQLRFAKEAIGRNWMFDFAWPDRAIALEIEGGTFMAKGAHTTGLGMMKDAEKYNAATLLGWRVFRVTDRMFRDGAAFDIVRRALTTEIRYQSPVLVEAQP
jgi:very-short-patch-repair endonuclease